MNCDPGQSSEAVTTDYIPDWPKWRVAQQSELVMASYNLRKSDKMDYNELTIPNYHKQKEFAIMLTIPTNFIHSWLAST